MRGTFDHDFDIAIDTDQAEAIERSSYNYEAEVAVVDDGGFDCAGTLGTWGTAGGSFGTVGTFGCCC